MSINFIKENIKKFDHDNLISFLFDIVIYGGLDDIEDFDANKSYLENEKVYQKDVDGVHHIYKCTVKQSTAGSILSDEWIDLLQSFRKPILTSESLAAVADVKEEVVISSENDQVRFTLNTPGVEDNMYTVVVFHPDLGRLSKEDFELVGRDIVLKDEFKVNNSGEKLIVDLYRMF